jgi:hypothetical protein
MTSVSDIGQQFQRCSALPGDDSGVVIGMDERRTRLVDDALECGLPRCQRRRTIHDAAPVPSHRRFLHRWGIVWHDDVRWHPAQPCHQRHRCRMIPRRMRSNPMPGFLV